MDVVDYEANGKEMDNRYAWSNLANENRVPEDHPGGDEAEADLDTKVADYVDRHLRTCRQIERVAADVSTVVVEVDDYRVDGEYRLIAGECGIPRGRTDHARAQDCGLTTRGLHDAGRWGVPSARVLRAGQRDIDASGGVSRQRAGAAPRGRDRDGPVQQRIRETTH
jgi:hypothetical protein